MKGEIPFKLRDRCNWLHICLPSKGFREFESLISHKHFGYSFFAFYSIYVKITTMKWLKEEIEKAINLNKEGKRFNEIALILNRNTRSVQVKLNNLGYAENKTNCKETLICSNCNEEFIAMKKDNRKFCSLSCSVTHNNKKYPKRKHIEKLKNCLNCGNLLNKRKQNKYCSLKCNIEYNKKQIITKIENGDTTLYEKQYKTYLINKFGNTCMKCNWHEINPTTGLVPIQLEHKDGNSENHNLNNLELLCPNCHSLTPTYGALNKGNGRMKRREKRQKDLIQKM
jgi:hypothetical protein